MLAFFGTFFLFLSPLEVLKHDQTIFFLVEEVLTFNLVVHMWKSVRNWLQKCIFYLGEIVFHILELSLSNVHLLAMSKTSFLQYLLIKLND